MPSPTPKPTLTVAALELAIAGDVGVVSGLFCEGVAEAELAITLFVDEVDDRKAVDEFELDEIGLDGLELDELRARLVMLK